MTRKFSAANTAEVACEGKVKLTFEQANAILKRNRGQRMAGRSIYRCQHCTHFHVGQSAVPKSKRRDG